MARPLGVLRFRLVIEFHWLIAGEFRLPETLANTLRRNAKVFALLGLALTLVPLVNPPPGWPRIWFGKR